MLYFVTNFFHSSIFGAYWEKISNLIFSTIIWISMLITKGQWTAKINWRVECNLVSMSPTFYEYLFHSKVFCAAFLNAQFCFVIFWCKNIGAKGPCFKFVKLTPTSRNLSMSASCWTFGLLFHFFPLSNLKMIFCFILYERGKVFCLHLISCQFHQHFTNNIFKQ